MPIAPQDRWHYRQSIEYEMTNNRAMLDLASRYRETLLYNIYQMGRNSIEKGSQDNWTITPKRIDALEAAAAKMAPAGGRRTRGGGGGGELPAGVTPGGGRARATVPTELYNTVLHDPKMRDPRGYIIPSDQADFATATEFVNALLKNGIDVMQARRRRSRWPARIIRPDRYVVKAAQAFRPHVMDMFEPQDHPNDFAYPGGPPKPPYDITGWTLAFQMGVQFDRILRRLRRAVHENERACCRAPPASITGTGSRRDI